MPSNVIFWKVKCFKTIKIPTEHRIYICMCRIKYDLVKVNNYDKNVRIIMSKHPMKEQKQRSEYERSKIEWDWNCEPKLFIRILLKWGICCFQALTSMETLEHCFCQPFWFERNIFVDSNTLNSSFMWVLIKKSLINNFYASLLPLDTSLARQANVSNWQ